MAGFQSGGACFGIFMRWSGGSAARPFLLSYVILRRLAGTSLSPRVSRAFLCGPATDVTVIATAHSDPANKGTGEDEPMLMAIRYGKGRVFHTTLGHDTAAMRCVGFIVTFQRGVEWAATGKVTQKPPKDFPTPTETRVR